MRYVQVTPQDVHHPRRHENGQRLAGYVGNREVMVQIGPSEDYFRLARHHPEQWICWQKSRDMSLRFQRSPEATTIEAMTTLDIVPYDARWALAFIEERDRIAVALGPLALRIEHHGSTSTNQELVVNPPSNW